MENLEVSKFNVVWRGLTVIIDKFLNDYLLKNGYLKHSSQFHYDVRFFIEFVFGQFSKKPFNYFHNTLIFFFIKN
jgi:hypothetical protein